MKKNKNSSVTVFTTLLSFLALGVLSLYFFITHLASLVLDLINLPPDIYFNKGSLYLFGVGVILLIFVAGIFYTYYQNKKLTSTANKKITHIIIFLLLTIFIMPQITHFTVESYFLKKGYAVCEAKSKQWLFVKTVVFSKDSGCD